MTTVAAATLPSVSFWTKVCNAHNTYLEKTGVSVLRIDVAESGIVATAKKAVQIAINIIGGFLYLPLASGIFRVGQKLLDCILSLFRNRKQPETAVSAPSVEPSVPASVTPTPLATAALAAGTPGGRGAPAAQDQAPPAQQPGADAALVLPPPAAANDA